MPLDYNKHLHCEINNDDINIIKLIDLQLFQNFCNNFSSKQGENNQYSTCFLQKL